METLPDCRAAPCAQPGPGSSLGLFCRYCSGAGFAQGFDVSSSKSKSFQGRAEVRSCLPSRAACLGAARWALGPASGPPGLHRYSFGEVIPLAQRRSKGSTWSLVGLGSQGPAKPEERRPRCWEAMQSCRHLVLHWDLYLQRGHKLASSPPKT